MTPLFNIVIFSKNRAAQLDLLLRSMVKYVPWAFHNHVTVIYKADPDYQASYHKIIVGNRNPNVQYVEEQEGVPFKEYVLKSIIPEAPVTMFLVDDNVFIGESPVMANGSLFTLMNNPDICCISQRIWKGTSFCYALNIPTPRPLDFDEVSCIWEWRGKQGEWCYPYSLDGNIFRTSQIHSLLTKIPFTGPNILEGNLDVYWDIPGSKMMCVPEPVLMNNPCNKVQSVYPNRSGSLSPLEIEQAFQSGMRLSLTPFMGLRPVAAHTEMPLTWENPC